MTKALATTEPQLALQQREPSVGLMLQTVIEKGVTSENVTALEQLVGLYERLEAKNAEKAFNSAFVELQNELPVIVAQSVIPNRGKYERFEDVMHVVKPLLIKNGFAVSFEQLADDKRIKVTCHLRHVGGHSQSTPFAVRLGGKADSDTQADCKASTTAKRNALLQALNIVIRQDCLQDEDDAHNEGGYISQQQADELRDWVSNLGADPIAFLEYASATKFEEIHINRLEALHGALRKKEKEARR